MIKVDYINDMLSKMNKDEILKYAKYEHMLEEKYKELSNAKNKVIDALDRLNYAQIAMFKAQNDIDKLNAEWTDVREKLTKNIKGIDSPCTDRYQKETNSKTVLSDL